MSHVKALHSEIHARISPQQVTTARLSFAPLWFVEETLQNELQTFWKNANDEALLSNITLRANVISLQVVYKVKSDGWNKKCLKGNFSIIRKPRQKQIFCTNKNTSDFQTHP